MVTDRRPTTRMQGIAHTAGEPMPGFNTPIPVEVTTPDRLATRLGELRFEDGVPTHETTERLFDLIDPETLGLLAAIGITKDAPFPPDERMRTILTDAAAVGNGTARAIAFRSREADLPLYGDRRWVTPFPGGDYRFLRDGGRGGRFLDARTMFFYLATVNTPAMALKMVGQGSQYALATVDVNDDALDGARTYRLRLPADVPAADFWSVIVYDPQTRSELQTGQPLPSRNSKRDALEYNDDGSVDVLFGPEEPQALASNWIQTVAGKRWFAIIRLYGPLEPWFDQSWKPGDIEPALGAAAGRRI